MEREIGQMSAIDSQRKKLLSTDNASLIEKQKLKAKETNSWDCSTPTVNGKISRKKVSDWDSSSECLETVVEPFDNDKDYDWDSESPKMIPSVGNEKKIFSSGSESLGFSVGDLSDVDKSSLIYGSEKVGNEEVLLVEDLEEFSKNDTPKIWEGDIDNKSEKVRSNRSGTPEDTTVWIIPKSERTQSADSSSRLVSGSGRELEKFAKKSKSLSNFQKAKNKRRSSRTTRSDCLGSDKSLSQCEGSSPQKKQKNLILGFEGFDRTRLFFTEVECRAMTVQKELTDKPSESSRSDESTTEEARSEQATNDNLSLNENRQTSTISRPGPSSNSDDLSMPNIQDRKPQLRKEFSRSYERVEGTGVTSPQIHRQTESWFLFENTGQYREISRNEVSILMNGRSADAVLQDKKEHVISPIKLTSQESLKKSLTSILTKESLQYFLKQEDLGGESSNKRLDLERKIENTLLYVQPGMNQTASIKIIPVEMEMIHIWRAARDTESRLSSEADILLSGQDSIGAVADNPSFENQVSREQILTERHDSQAPGTTQNKSANSLFYPLANAPNYSKLLIETREIVDNLTENFKILQNRLDGETHKSLVLQNEVNKMKVLLRSTGIKFGEMSTGELIFDHSINSTPSLLTIKAIDKAELRSESIIEEECEDECNSLKNEALSENPSARLDEENPNKTTNQVSGNPNPVSVQESNIITVNIYTIDDNRIGILPTPASAYESNSLIQSNLTLVEEKMKRLQAENDSITTQNGELKKKLREISLELEKYMSEAPEQEMQTEEGRDVEALRKQVCNLKLELESLKKLAGSEKTNLLKENFLIREELQKSLVSLKEWDSAAAEIFEKIQSAKDRLKETGIDIDEGIEPETACDPKTFLNLINVFVQQTARNLIIVKNENYLYEESVKKDVWKRDSAFQDTSALDQVISDYTELIEKCKKGQITGEMESKIMEDYFAIIMEKATLVEEIKILKTENEMLMENQEQQYEKLKQAMISLKDQKKDIGALESAQKLSEEEKEKMSDVLKLNNEEMCDLKREISMREKAIEDLTEEIKRKDREISDRDERLKAAIREINNLGRSCQMKDDLIDELKKENNALSAVEGMKDDEIRILKEEIKKLEIQGAELESELTSSKVFLNQSQKEMTEYISHLETVINNSQESLDKVKQKLKESNLTISRLKSDNEVLEKEHQCDVKLFNQTKDELESVKGKLAEAKKKLEDAELQRKETLQKMETLTNAEREKTEALEVLSKEYKALLEESAELKNKVVLLSKDKDETLKEQKDLINKYAMLSKEVQRLQDKYKSVKTECNERTDLIRYLEMLLKENLIEYTNRISCLEKNISRLVEKIAACKNNMRDKHSGGDAEVKELRHQLDVTCQERKELENIVNNYYSLMKHLEGEIQEREKRVDELHVKLLEQQKTAGNFRNVPESRKTLEDSTIEELENEVKVTRNELAECRKELQSCQISYENEKKKMELTIADLKSEVNRYQIRLEVLMRNLSSSSNTLNPEKRNDSAQALKKELEDKGKKIAELTDLVNKYVQEITAKDADLENFKKKTASMEEELKSSQSRIAKLQDVLSATNKTSDLQQKERDEMAEKLLQSIKLIMEEKSARQTIETLAAEKEKNMRNRVDQLQSELGMKIKEIETLSDALEDKRNIINKLQNDLKRMKQELNSYKKKSSHKGNAYLDDCNGISNAPSERLEKCMKELKEVRDLNLELRKAEGQYQAKIVRLEDEIRDSRLLIKELQGDIKTERKSKKALKNVIMAAKTEIEKCLLAKQLMSVVADRISRHLDLAELPSRELLSGFRLSDS